MLGLLYLALEHPTNARELIEDAFKYDPHTVGAYLDGGQVKILPFNSNCEFSQRFPLTEIRINKSRPIVTPIQLSRPSLTPPRAVLPGLDFTVEHTVLQYFTVISTQLSHIPFKPEPPWLNRVNGTAIQFTDALNEQGSYTVSVSATEETEEHKTEAKENLSEDSVLDLQKKFRSVLVMPRKFVFSDEEQEGEEYYSSEREEEHQENPSGATPDYILERINALCSPVV